MTGAPVGVEPPVGPGRIALSSAFPNPSRGEVAFTTVDEWQGVGIGTALLRELARCCRKFGIVRWRAVFLAGNRRPQRFLEAVGHKLVERDPGCEDLQIEAGRQVAEKKGDLDAVEKRVAIETLRRPLEGPAAGLDALLSLRDLDAGGHQQRFHQ